MIVTATELKANLGHYLSKLAEGDIIITRNGKRIARLVDINRDKTDILESLIGILPTTVTVEQAKAGRLEQS